MKNQTLTAIALTDWFTGTETLVTLGFTIPEIEAAIIKSGNSKETLTETKGFENYPTYLKTFEVVRENYTFKTKKYNGEWEKEVTVMGWEIRVKAQYQSLRHSEILFCLFCNKWDWFNKLTFTKECEVKTRLSELPISEIPKEFQHLTANELRSEYLIKKELENCSRWDIYNCESQHFEIYLKTGNDKGSDGLFKSSFISLYVPVEALVKSDFSIIEERMKNYWGSYYKTDLSGYALNHRGRTEEQYIIDQQAAQNEHLSALESEEAQQLKKYLSN
jgi:hypothetical protein